MTYVRRLCQSWLWIRYLPAAFFAGVGNQGAGRIRNRANTLVVANVKTEQEIRIARGERAFISYSRGRSLTISRCQVRPVRRATSESTFRPILFPLSSSRSFAGCFISPRGYISLRTTRFSVRLHETLREHRAAPAGACSPQFLSGVRENRKKKAKLRTSTEGDIFVLHKGRRYCNVTRAHARIKISDGGPLLNGIINMLPSPRDITRHYSHLFRRASLVPSVLRFQLGSHPLVAAKLRIERR